MQPSQLECRFNTTVVAARVVHSSEIACVTPASDTGVVNLQIVTHELREAFANVLKFEYFHVNAALASPNAGPVAGGTVIHFLGKRIGNAGGVLTCEFLLADHLLGISNATLESADRVSCISTRVAAPGRFDIRLVSHSAPLAYSTFLFHAAASLHRLHPAHGPLAGGTTVQLHGEFFGQIIEPTCIFGTTNTPARLLNDHTMVCVSPPHSTIPAGDKTVLVSGADGVLHIMSGSVPFTYLAEMIIAQVRPSHGPTVGSSMVAIQLGNQGRSTTFSPAQCLFGSIGKWSRVPATFLAPGTLACVSPPRSEGIASIHVASAFLEHPPDTAIPATFHYVDVLVLRAAPLSGPLTGGTRVQFTGQRVGLLQNVKLSCLFGGIASPALAVMSAQHILCAAPTYHAADVVDLELIVENANHPQVATFMFRYYEGPGDFNVSPVVVPIRGGSSITITGMCL